MILKKKKSCFEEELAKNKNKLKELWKVLKSFGLSSDKAIKIKNYSYERRHNSLWSNENPNIRFYPELAGDLQEKLPKAPNKFTDQTTKKYYDKTSFSVSNNFKLSNVSEEVIKNILLSLNTSKTAGNQIPAKILRGSPKVLALPLRNVINWSTKLSTFP